MKIARILATATGAVTLAVVAALPAQAALGDAVIKAASNTDGGLGICKSWSGTSADPGCRSGTPRGTLYAGQNSKTKYGWVDTDGVILSAGCDLYNLSGNVVSYGYAGSTKEVKISGLNGATFTYEERC